MELPSDFKERMKQQLGDAYADFLASYDAGRTYGLRYNPLKITKENLLSVFRDSQIQLEPVMWAEEGFYYPQEAQPGKFPLHEAGAYYIQEPSAMSAAALLNPGPGERVLDLCAAPGGKSTQIAGRMKGEGLLLANEAVSSRAKILSQNIERMGIANALVLNETPERLAERYPVYFDRIAVDAPCSGEGMFRKDPHAITYWHANYPAQCAKRQREILTEAVKMLAVGGELIYSTCTFAPEEDEQIISWLLQEYPYFEIVPLQKYTGMDSGIPAWGNDEPTLTGTIRLMPHHFKGEGHFIAKLRDTRPVQVVKTKKNKRKKQNKASLTQEQVALWKEFSANFLKQDLFKVTELQCYGDHLYYYNKNWPDISRLKFMRPGLLLGVFKKKRFEPSYTLALSLSATETDQKLALTYEQWQQYVAGNTVTVTTPHKNGWYLLICDDKPFAFGKVVNGTVKNFFPKGLRFSFE